MKHELKDSEGIKDWTLLALVAFQLWMIDVHENGAWKKM